MRKGRFLAKGCSISLLVVFCGPLLTLLSFVQWSVPHRKAAQAVDLAQIRTTKVDSVSAAQREFILVHADPRFYEHEGIDGRAIANACYVNLFRKETPVHVPGTQTLTLSVALHLLPQPRSGREIHDWHFASYFLARRLEKHFTKEEIFDLYLSLEDSQRLRERADFPVK